MGVCSGNQPAVDGRGAASCPGDQAAIPAAPVQLLLTPTLLSLASPPHPHARHALSPASTPHPRRKQHFVQRDDEGVPQAGVVQDFPRYIRLVLPNLRSSQGDTGSVHHSALLGGAGAGAEAGAEAGADRNPGWNGPGASYGCVSRARHAVQPGSSGSRRRNWQSRHRTTRSRRVQGRHAAALGGRVGVRTAPGRQRGREDQQHAPVRLVAAS